MEEITIKKTENGIELSPIDDKIEASDMILAAAVNNNDFAVMILNAAAYYVTYGDKVREAFIKDVRRRLFERYKKEGVKDVDLSKYEH